MNHQLEIQKILLKVEKQTTPEDKITLLKQAVNIADLNNDVDWGIDLRLDILQNEVDTPACIESFPAFIWILNAHENNPDIINEGDFLWAYKWMADEAISSSDISFEQLEDILNDFRLRLSRNGYSDRAYYNLLVFKHMFLGEFEAAHKTLDIRDKSPSDRMSDSKPWEQNVKVLLALKEGKFDDAIFLAQDILSKKLVSEGLPFATLSSMVYYLAKANDPRSKDYLDAVAEEITKDKLCSAFICNIAQVALAFYMNGHIDKAWKYFEQTVHWEINACDFLKFDYIVFILPLLQEKGKRELKLSPKVQYYKEDNIYDIDDLYNYYYPIAEKLATKFDERNRNSVFSDRLKDHMSLRK